MHLVEGTFCYPWGGSSLGKDSAGLVLRVLGSWAWLGFAGNGVVWLEALVI